MKKVIDNRFLFVTGMIVLGAMSRFIPHLPNFTPLASMALFGGALYGSRTKAFLMPLLILFLSDLFLGFHTTILFVYAGFLAITGIGFWLKGRLNVSNVIIAALLSSLLFFILTNFGVWVMYDFYPKNFAGLSEAYVAGIPFFRNDLLGNFFYSGVFFGIYYWVKASHPQWIAVSSK